MIVRLNGIVLVPGLFSAGCEPDEDAVTEDVDRGRDEEDGLPVFKVLLKNVIRTLKPFRLRNIFKVANDLK